MPTIEIISINSQKINLNQKEFKVAIIEENELISHRSLFYDFLISQSGVIFHIGNPDFKNDKDGFYFAGEIIDWENEPSEEDFRFLAEYEEEIDRILRISLEKSPINKIYFLSDYQFALETSERKSLSSIEEFWGIYKKEGLQFNTLYEIRGNKYTI